MFTLASAWSTRASMPPNAFIKAATRAGLDGLKGHRSVGGMRASMYNAFPLAGVDALISLMREFEASHA